MNGYVGLGGLGGVDGERWEVVSSGGVVQGAGCWVMGGGCMDKIVFLGGGEIYGILKRAISYDAPFLLLKTRGRICAIPLSELFRLFYTAVRAIRSHVANRAITSIPPGLFSKDPSIKLIRT